MIDKNSFIPLYAQVRNEIMRRLVERQWLPRTPIPPEKDLMEMFGVSRITISKAVNELVREGFLVRQKGRGTFVASPRHSYRFTTLISFTEELRSMGVKPESQILDFSIIPAVHDVADRLKINHGDQVLRLERLRFADGDPVSINISRLPLKLCPDLKVEDIGNNSLYKLLEECYHLYIKKAYREFETIEAGLYESRLMKIKPGTPILKLVGTVTDPDGVVIDYCEEYYK